MRSKVSRRIFVVGVPRSGTTLVQSLLASHGCLTSFTESHLFSRHFWVLPASSRVVLIRDPTPRLRDFLAENEIEASRSAPWLVTSGGALRKRVPAPLQTRRVADRLLSTLDHAAAERGVSGWVEKTPAHLRYIPFLHRRTPVGVESRFVHVVRRGIDVVISLHLASRHWERPYDLRTCARRWNRDVRFSFSRISSPRDHFVFYEDLTADPEGSAEQLLGALGLDWQSDIVARFGETSSRLITDEEVWKSNTGRTIQPSSAGSKELSSAQIEHLESTLRTDLYRDLRQAVRGAKVQTEE